MANTIKAALIDLDGTLLDTLPDIVHAANSMRREMFMPPLAPKRVSMFVGKGAEELVRRMIVDRLDDEIKVDQKTVNRGVRLFKIHYRAVSGRLVEWYPNVVEGLHHMQALGLRLACVTNKPREFTLPLLERTGLAPFFATVIAGEDAPKKPAPDMMLLACKNLGVAPQEATVVGDSLNDAQSARAAGCKVLMVPYGYNEGKPVDATTCDAIVSDLLDAARWMAEHNQHSNP
jgi:phosphoglycolate phosphatase